MLNTLKMGTLLAGMALMGCLPVVSQDKTPQDMVGSRPTYSLNTTAGTKVTNKNMKGKVVLLDFWATWCGPCKAASPSMQELHKEYWKKGLRVIGVDVFEAKAGSGPAKGYAKDHGYSYTFAYNADEMAKAWNVRGIPQFFLIDKTGKVRYAFTGWDPKGSSKNTIETAVKKLLAE